MRTLTFIFTVCSLLLCCHSPKEDEIIVLPDSPEETETTTDDRVILPCSCGDEWPENVKTICNYELPSWDYPYYYGTDDWKKFQSWEEVVEACQIPEDVIDSLSTIDLTALVMKCVLILSELNPLPDESIDSSLDSLFKHFNGVRALFQREDAIDGLLNWYRSAMIDVSFFDDDSIDGSFSIGLFLFQIAGVSKLLSRYQFPENSEGNYVEILQHLVCGFEKMLSHPGYFGAESFGANFFSRLKILIRIDEQLLEKIPQGGNNPLFENYYGWFTFGCDRQTKDVIDELSCELISLY